MNTYSTLPPMRRVRGGARHGRRGMILCFALLASVAPARAEWFYDAQIGGMYDDNLTRAQQAADVRADGAVTLSGDAGWFYAPSGNDGFSLSLDANSGAYARFHGLNLVSIGAAAVYRHKFGVGYAAPWISATVSAAHDSYRDDIRDGERYDARLEFGQRLSERFDASVGIAIDRRDARNDRPVVPGISGKVFDLRGQSAFARAGYDITDTLQLGGSVSVRRGDVESTTRQNLDIFLASDAIAADPTFGSDFFAYRLRGTTQSAHASLSWALSDHSSLNASYAFAHTASYDDLVYRARIGSIILAYRY